MGGLAPQRRFETGAFSVPLPADGLQSATLLARWLQQRFGTRIILIPTRMPKEIHGAAMLAQDALVIYFRGDADPFFRTRIVLHELAHWLLGHLADGRAGELRPASSLDPEEAAAEEAVHATLYAALGIGAEPTPRGWQRLF
ncbi:MAG: hypothetical protein IMW99_05545 [Firmicutes bacterium]|nr:hypothetical protein [Bacillota bacterium]